MTGGVIVKKSILIIVITGILLVTGCGIKNNKTTDNNDTSDLNPTTDVSYKTTTCSKDEDKDGVKDKTSYEIHHDGSTVKSITMNMHYELTDENGSGNVFDDNKSIFNDIKDAFVDAVNVTTNVVEDSANLFRANVEVMVENMDDDAINSFDKFKISKDLEQQKKHFEDDGYTCN